MIKLKFIFFMNALLTSSLALALDETFECILQPEMMVELGSATPGILDSVEVKRGDVVTTDQVVARLVSDVEQAAVDVAQARVDASAQLDSAEIRKAFSERKYQRTIELSNKKYVAEFNLDEAETEKFLADKALVEANEALELSKAELRRAQAYLALKHIKSPFDGVVVDRYRSPGERVDEDPILKLAKVNPLYVEVLLPIEMLGRIQAEQEGVVTTEFDSGQELMAKVVVIDRVVDAASGLFGVRLELPNPDLKITAGLECQVKFDFPAEP